MIPTKPYLLRAIYEWAIDNDLTPQILVDATAEGVNVPSAYVKDGQILLNIHPQAVHGLVTDNEAVMFSARFSGTQWDIFVPINATLAIFARENSQGIFFQADDAAATPGVSGVADAPETADEPGGPRPVTSADTDASPETDPDSTPPRPDGGRPKLRIVD